MVLYYWKVFLYSIFDKNIIIQKKDKFFLNQEPDHEKT